MYTITLTEDERDLVLRIVERFADSREDYQLPALRQCVLKLTVPETVLLPRIPLKLRGTRQVALTPKHACL